MTTIQTPLRVAILIAFHLNKSLPDGSDSVAGREAFKCFFDNGVLEDVGGIHGTRLTPLGEAWVKTILNTPIPRIAYLDQHGKEIE